MSDTNESQPETPIPTSLVTKGADRVRAEARRFLKTKAMQLAQSHLRLIRDKRDPRRGLAAVPERMRTAAKQLELMTELIDDFRSGRYRSLSWKSFAVMSGAAAYTLSPADVIPDVIVGFGLLDDAIVLSIATGIVQKELEDYCRFKGYEVESYFPDPKTAGKPEPESKDDSEEATTKEASHAA